MEDWGRVVVMLPIAMAASAAMLVVVWREGWLSMAHRRRVVRRELVALNRIGAASVVYVLLLFAYPPPMDVDRLALVAAVFGLWLAIVGVVWILSARTDAWADGPKVGEALQSEIVFEMEGDDGDETDDDGWVIVPFDSGVGGGLHGGTQGRNQDSRSASTDGYGEIRLPVSGSESASGSTGGAGASSSSGGESQRINRSGAGEQPNGNRAGAGENNQGNGMASSATVPSANRGGRGRRLSGGFVSG